VRHIQDTKLIAKPSKRLRYNGKDRGKRCCRHKRQDNETTERDSSCLIFSDQAHLHSQRPCNEATLTEALNVDLVVVRRSYRDQPVNNLIRPVAVGTAVLIEEGVHVQDSALCWVATAGRIECQGLGVGLAVLKADGEGNRRGEDFKEAGSNLDSAADTAAETLAGGPLLGAAAAAGSAQLITLAGLDALRDGNVGPGHLSEMLVRVKSDIT
jgi:hypothetical protein